MTRRKWFLLVLAACLAGSAYLGFALREQGLTPFEKLEVGMGQEQVELCLGRQTSAFGTGTLVMAWPFEDGTLTVGVVGGKLASKKWTPTERSFWDKVRVWLRL